MDDWKLKLIAGYGKGWVMDTVVSVEEMVFIKMKGTQMKWKFMIPSIASF